MIILNMIKKILMVVVGGLVLAGCTPETKKEEIMVTPTVMEETDQQLLGGDRDEHGCIGSAGYSWCEAKQKCLRNWEEKCEEEKIEETVGEVVTRILVKKYNWEGHEVLVRVEKEIGDFASGSVRFGDVEDSGGGWLTRKVEGKWEVVWDGQGSVDCQKLRNEYGFPDEILKPGFCD